MLLAEELLLVGLDPDGRPQLGMFRNVVVAGAFLAELALRERLAIDDRGRLQVVDSSSTGDPLLDDALVRFGERAGKKPKSELERIGKKLVDPTLQSLARRELVRPEPVTMLGMTMSTRWPSLAPAQRAAVVAELARVIVGSQPADARTGALVALLRGVDTLHKVVPKEARPGMSNSEVRKRGKEITKGRWAPEAVAKAVEEATAAIMAAVAVGAATSSG